MRFWITAAIGVVALTGVLTWMQINNPDNIRYETPLVKEDIGPPPTEGAVFAADKYAVKFENLPQGKVGMTTFDIWNDGKADLDLKVDKPSCTCAGAEFEGGKQEARLKPKEKIKFIVQYDTKKRLADYSVVAPIRTNDPAKPQVQFKLDLQVVQDIVFNVPDIVFGQMSEGNKLTRDFLVYSPHFSNLELHDFRTQLPALKISSKALSAEELAGLKAKAGYRVTVATDGTQPVGAFVDRVDFKTNIASSPELSIGVQGEVAGSISVEPARFAFGNITNDKLHEKIGRIFAAGLPKDDRLVLGKVEPAFVKVEIKRNPNVAIVWELRVSIPPKAPPGQYVGEQAGFIIINDSKGNPRISMRVSAIIADGSISVGGG